MVVTVIIVILLSIEALAFSHALFSVPSYLRRIAEALERRNKDGEAD